MHTIAERKLLMLRPDEIIIPKDKFVRNYDNYELERLADCIAANGIIEPLSVRRQKKRYVLISGERRLLAAKAASLRRIPCVVHKIDDMNADFYSVIENLQRCSPNAFEEAEEIQQLLKRYKLTHTEAALKLGISQSSLTSRLRLLKLDAEQRRRIVSSGLTSRHAKALLRLSEEKRNEALDEILAEGLTIRQTDKLIEKFLHPDEEASAQTEPIRKMAVGDVRFFSNSLNKLVDKARSAGINAQTRRNETEKYIEYKVRIKKECPASDCQLHIC